MNNMNKREIKKAYVDMVERYSPFDFFIHLTFRADVSQVYAEKARNQFFRHMNELVFGRRYREEGKGLFIAYASAPQERGTPHFHLVVSGGEYHWGCVGVYLHLFEKFWNDYGLSEMKRYDNSKGLAGVNYLVNHIYKNGEIDFSYPKNPHINVRGMRFKGGTYKRLKELKYI